MFVGSLRGVDEPSGLVGSTRLAEDVPIACPAGVAVGESARGAGCHCRVTDSEVSSASDPSSLLAFCANPDGYVRCPVWRAEKEQRWESREGALEARRRGASTIRGRQRGEHKELRHMEVEGAASLVADLPEDHPAYTAFM